MAESKSNNGRDQLDGPINERIFVVHTEYATFALIADYHDLLVKHAPPIAAWAIGKSSIEVLRWYIINKNAQIQTIIIKGMMLQ